MNQRRTFLGIAALVIVLLIGWKWYYSPKHDGGDKVEDFEVNLIDGRKFKLSDLRGNYVLLDFWGSWCGPCRRANRNLVILNEKFGESSFKNAKGFEIISIGLETNERSWKRAIENDGLTWDYHHADFKRMRTAVARQFNVRQIPTKFLIGPDGDIISVNPGFEELDQLLSEDKM